MAQAQQTLGAILRKKTAPALTIKGLTSIGEIGIESEEIDVTTLDSTSGYKEFISGFKDGGEVSIAGFIKDEDNMEDMSDLADAQTLVDWELLFPNGSAWTFTGFVKMFKEAEVAVNGARGFTGSIRISGKPEYFPEGMSV